ncbi:MAG: hypothetical protein CMI55_03260 [Parcubacteria group bacterium]|jgi:type II secretory ATPase GspE/PulE/Tfp pilus assembly ATPase PilB-like protein|nr:hypothetical protein [Parcubacteria group bacterium]|tara:strand:+ start:11966 stop:14962 length:2997 start_codon:yes stop_codon:yes gene_type:complete
MPLVNPKVKTKKLEEKLTLIKRQEEETSAKRLAQELDLPYINLAMTAIDSDSLAILPKETAQKGEALIIRKYGKILRLAVRNPDNPQTVEIIEQLERQGFECKFFIVSLTSLEIGWQRYELTAPKSSSIRGILTIQKEELEEFEKSLKTIQDLKKTISNLSTTGLLSIIVAGAIKMKASDIHFEPGKKGIKMRYRIDGLLQEITIFPTKSYRFLLSRVKTLSDMIINVHDISQDGRFTIRILGDKKSQDIDMRVSVLPTGYGESIVIRLLGLGIVELNLPDLGIRPELFELAKMQITRPNGMVLTTGPTGSGKTTTLYACLEYVNKPENKIITVEDPIEYRLKGITQTQINKRKGQTFAKVLKTVVRQDPDTLMVGEIRDKESADIAVHSALTGHIVFSTLHANDAASAVPRLIDIGVKPAFIPQTLNLVIAQRLVRRLCPYCKKPYNPSDQMIKDTKKIFSLISPKTGIDIPRKISTFYKPQGCPKCHGLGYQGRIGIFEFFTVSQAIEKMILEKGTSFELRAKAMQQGMMTLMQDAMLRIVEGTTSMEELQRVIGSPQYIEQLYGQSIMSMLTRALIITDRMITWAKSIVLGDKKTQKKLDKVKMEDLVEWLAVAALHMKATDIHLEAEENIFKIRLRIDSALEEIAQIPKELFLSVVAKIKELAGMDIEVHQRTQDGRFKIDYPDGKSYDTRISVIPSGYGESVIIRLLRSDIGILTLEELGLRKESLKIIQKAIKSPNGIIFVTGPTSAGKTTTLYSILNQLNRPEVKIFTIEDPIEYRLKGIIQTQINKEEGYTFLEALRALLRQNPNIIMLGEVRDAETAQAAIQASLTGHLVLTTLHTNSAVEAIQRLNTLGIKADDISSSLRAIVAQRLVRKLCQKCKKEIKIPAETLAQIKKELKKIPASYKQGIKQIKLYQPGKCKECNQRGYQGQMAIFEILTADDEIKQKIRDSINPTELEKLAKEKGMVALYQDGLLNALKGITSLDEVERVTTG